MEDKIDITRIRKGNSSGNKSKFRPMNSFDVNIDGVNEASSIINVTNDVSHLNIGKIGSILNDSQNIDAEFEDVDYISDSPPDAESTKKMD